MPIASQKTAVGLFYIYIHPEVLRPSKWVTKHWFCGHLPSSLYSFSPPCPRSPLLAKDIAFAACAWPQLRMMKSSLLCRVDTPKFSVISIKTLRTAGLHVLGTADVFEKARLTQLYCQAWNDRIIHIAPSSDQESRIASPNKPARPSFGIISDNIEKSLQRSVKSMMKHNSIEYSLHGIANAESYAIDLFWDIMIRYGGTRSDIPVEFYDDMVYIVEQEAQHFIAWTSRLKHLSIPFGLFPSNDTLWNYAEITVGTPPLDSI
jgi:hypothetical protein